MFRPDYELDIDDALLADLSVENPADVVVLSLVTVPSDGSPVTANLQGPLVINKKNNKSFQAILSDNRWKTKHDIVAESASKKVPQC